MTFASDESSPPAVAEVQASETGIEQAMAVHIRGAVANVVADARQRVQCSADNADQWYRATIAHQDSEIPFFLALSSCQRGEARIVNGDDTVTVQMVRDGSAIVLDFSLYQTRLELSSTSGGALAGQWVSKSPIATSASLSVHAQPIDQPDERSRFAVATAQGEQVAAELAGDWKVTFQGSGTGKLSLKQPLPGVVTGVVHFPTGDMQYLAGNIIGDELRLSRFNGISPYLIVAEIRDNRKLKGTWIAGQNLDWREQFTARKSRSAKVKTEVELSRGHTTLDLPELASDRYKGRPVIVEFAASWCTACAHVSPVLRDIYRRHNDQGLDIITYTYEFTDDEDYNRKQAALFKKLHDLSWEMIPVNGTLDDYWNIVPRSIKGFDELSFPVTFFINPDGSIQGAQAGFPPPAAKHAYQASTDTYDRLSAEIVANHVARTDNARPVMHAHNSR